MISDASATLATLELCSDTSQIDRNKSFGFITLILHNLAIASHLSRRFPRWSSPRAPAACRPGGPPALFSLFSLLSSCSSSGGSPLPKPWTAPFPRFPACLQSSIKDGWIPPQPLFPTVSSRSCLRSPPPRSRPLRPLNASYQSRARHRLACCSLSRSPKQHSPFRCTVSM